jgi:hypothetical protein
MDRYKKVVARSQPSTPDPGKISNAVASKTNKQTNKRYSQPSPLHISIPAPANTMIDTDLTLLVPVELLEDQMQKQIYIDT